MKRIFFLLLIMILSLGCIKGEEYHINIPGKNIMHKSIWVDKDIENQEEVISAISDWNWALNGNIILDIKSVNFNMEIDDIKNWMNEDGWLILNISSKSKFKPADRNGYYILGYCDRISGGKIYLIKERVKKEDARMIMRHEIGHLLGARHGDGKLMEPLYDMESFKCIDYKTMLAMSERFGFSINQANYCN